MRSLSILPKEFIRTAVAIAPLPSVSRNLYTCENNEFIQSVQVCDGVSDCRDGSDERNCCKFYLKRGFMSTRDLYYLEKEMRGIAVSSNITISSVNKDIQMFTPLTLILWYSVWVYMYMKVDTTHFHRLSLCNLVLGLTDILLKSKLFKRWMSYGDMTDYGHATIIGVLLGKLI